METNNSNDDKEVRPVIFSEADYATFDSEFRILCALKDQTIGERFAELMKADLKAHASDLEGDWISQQGLVEELEAMGKAVTRQTLRNHRKNGTLPAEYFVESKIESDSPNAAKNQRSYYRKAECLAFYSQTVKN